MLKFTAPVDNIHDAKDAYAHCTLEQLQLTRSELDKRILRTKTTQGTDVGIQLDSGVRLRHGDVLKDGDMQVVITQLPEKTLSIKLLALDKPDVLVLLGHIIGNRHRPISIHNDVITFPIQSDTEKTTFEKLLHDLIPYIELTVTEQIFIPHRGADVHGH